MADQVVRVLRVAVVADRGADVVEQRAVLEQLAVGVAHRVRVSQPVEQLQREPRDMPRVTDVALLGLELLQQLQDAAHREILDTADGGDLAGVGRDVVGDEALAHAEVGDHDARRVECLEHVLEHERSGQQDLRALRVEPVQRLALGERHATELPDQPRQARRREQVLVQLPQGLARLLEVRECSQRVDGPRRTIDLPGVELAHRGQRLRAVTPDRPLELVQLGPAGRIGFEERLGEP